MPSERRTRRTRGFTPRANGLHTSLFTAAAAGALAARPDMGLRNRLRPAGRLRKPTPPLCSCFLNGGSALYERVRVPITGGTGGVGEYTPREQPSTHPITPISTQQGHRHRDTEHTAGLSGPDTHHPGPRKTHPRAIRTSLQRGRC